MKQERVRPESARQFDQIWLEHHNPENVEKRKIKKNRENRQDTIKKDLGL